MHHAERRHEMRNGGRPEGRSCATHATVLEQTLETALNFAILIQTRKDPQ